MLRLGLWGPGSPFPGGFREFKLAVDKGGIGMMELTAMHLKRYLKQTYNMSHHHLKRDKCFVGLDKEHIFAEH